MYWQEDKPETFIIPDDIVDLTYKINCRCLPIEHAHALSNAIQAALPWLADEPLAGIHLIHVAESSNGWMRPEDNDNEILYLSRRTRMTLRLPKTRIADAQQLTGKTLDISGHDLIVGQAHSKLLSDSSTLFSRYVIGTPEQMEDEQQFITMVATEAQELGIPVRKLLCGKPHALNMPEQDILTRSVMLADLSQDEAIKLQQQGIGAGRKIGCGLFIPHKSITAVNQ